MLFITKLNLFNLWHILHCHKKSLNLFNNLEKLNHKSDDLSHKLMLKKCEQYRVLETQHYPPLVNKLS